jgi:chromosome segregation ATPase
MTEPTALSRQLERAREKRERLNQLLTHVDAQIELLEEQVAEAAEAAAAPPASEG